MDDKTKTVKAAAKLVSMTKLMERMAATGDGIELGAAYQAVGDEFCFRQILRTLSDCNRATVKNGRLVAIRKF